MRRRNSRFLTCAMTLVLLLSLAGLVGCGGGGGGGTGDAVAMMDKLPKDTEAFSFVDVKAIRSDKDLDKAFEGLKDDIKSEFEELGVSVDDVDSMAQGASVTILEGRFDLGNVSKELEDNDYDDDKYKGVEIWEGDLSVALVSASYIVTGEDLYRVEDCIDVIKGDDDSLHDDANLQDLVSRLPSGIALSVYPGDYEEYEGLEAVGYSLVKKAADTMRVTTIYRFEDEGAASASADDIEKDMKEDIEGTTATNVAVTRDGKIDDMFEESDDGGTSDLEGARTELVTAQVAIQACLADAGASQLDSAVAAWDGSGGKVKATVDSQTYDAADYLRGDEFEATYAVAIDGTITGGTNVSWSGITWDSVDDTWVEKP